MRALALATVVAAALAASGCGGSSKREAATTRARTTHTQTAIPTPAGGCAVVSERLLARIRRGVVLVGAQLLNPKAVAAGALPGYFFVSARVRGGGAPRNAVATWATTSLEAGGGKIYALDRFAATISQFGSGISANPQLVIQASGVRRSRVCAAGPNAPLGATAPANGQGGAVG